MSKEVCVGASSLFEVLRKKNKQQPLPYLIKINTIIEKGF